MNPVRIWSGCHTRGKGTGQRSGAIGQTQGAGSLLRRKPIRDVARDNAESAAQLVHQDREITQL